MIFTDRENILLCQTASPNDLAEKILELKSDPELREKIARGGYDKFRENATPFTLGAEIFKLIRGLSKK